MLFPDSFIDELKQRLPISKIVGRRVKLKRNGLVHKGLCPFHQEKTPSFSAQDQKAMYYCFGCHASGDIIKFVMETEKTSFEDALVSLANLAGMPLPKQDPVEQKKIERNISLVDVVTKAANWFKDQLKLSINHEAYEYFNSRGINDNDIQTFSLGYAPSKGLLTFLQKEGVSLDTAVDVGLAIKLEGKSYVDRFRNRIMFPIKNHKNQIVGFGGRSLNSETMPKYLNSPETSIFKKNNLLYVADIAAKHSIKNERVIVVEGYMDAIFMHKAGLQETVASLGTAFNQTHLQLLWKMANEPILCFDGDEAGKKAMIKAAYTALPLLSPGVSLKFCLLPSGLDPDDVIKQQGVTFINKLIDKSLSLSDFIWQSELHQSNLKTPEGKALFEHKIYELIKEITNPIVRNYYQQFIKTKLWQELSEFKPGDFKKTKLKYVKESPLGLLSDQSSISRLLYSLFAQIITYPDLLKEREILDSLLGFEIENQEIDFLRSILIESNENEEKLLNDLLIQNNLGKLTEFLCGDESSFIDKISTMDLTVAKEVWLITYKKHLLEILKNEYNEFMRKASFENKAFSKATELKKTIDQLIKEISEQENNLI